MSRRASRRRAAQRYPRPPTDTLWCACAGAVAGPAGGGAAADRRAARGGVSQLAAEQSACAHTAATPRGPHALSAPAAQGRIQLYSAGAAGGSSVATATPVFKFVKPEELVKCGRQPRQGSCACAAPLNHLRAQVQGALARRDARLPAHPAVREHGCALHAHPACARARSRLTRSSQASGRRT
jgi:hypothetical protein